MPNTTNTIYTENCKSSWGSNNGNAELIKLTENASSWAVFSNTLINIRVYWNVRSVHRHQIYEEIIFMVGSSRILRNVGTCLLQYTTWHIRCKVLPFTAWKPQIPQHNLTNFRVLLLRHPRCVCNNEVKGKVSQNTTSFIGVNETICFGLLGGHHQVCKVLRD